MKRERSGEAVKAGAQLLSSSSGDALPAAHHSHELVIEDLFGRHRRPTKKSIFRARVPTQFHLFVDVISIPPSARRQNAGNESIRKMRRGSGWAVGRDGGAAGEKGRRLRLR